VREETDSARPHSQAQCDTQKQMARRHRTNVQL
jgi:hypothetical protein